MGRLQHSGGDDRAIYQDVAGVKALTDGTYTVMPQYETCRIQEDRLAVYHLLCAVVEYEIFNM